MHLNLFTSVLIALLAGFVTGAFAFFLIYLVSRLTQKPWVRRITPSLLAIAFCLSILRFMDALRVFLERLAYQHDLNKLVVLGLLAAALAVGFRLSFLIFSSAGAGRRAAR